MHVYKMFSGIFIFGHNAKDLSHHGCRSPDTLFAMFSQVDVVINNAGMSYRGNASDTTMDVHIKVMMVNYFGQVALTRGLIPY